MVHRADRTGQERLVPCNPDARVPILGTDPDPRPLRGARRARRGGRVRAGGAPARCSRRAAGLRGDGRAGRWRDPDADGHLAAARRPARERLDHRAVALRQPQHPRWPVRRLAGRARRKAPDRLPAAHRRPLRAGGRPRDGGRPGRLPATESRAPRPATPGGSHSTRPTAPGSCAAGVPLHPSFGYEIAFHLLAFLLLWFWLRRMGPAAGGDVHVVRRRLTRCSGSWSSSCAATRWRGRD